MKKRVVILGSTGSIGTSALKVARDIPERMEVVALAAHSNAEKLAEQAREFGVKHVCIYDSTKVATLHFYFYFCKVKFIKNINNHDTQRKRNTPRTGY